MVIQLLKLGLKVSLLIILTVILFYDQQKTFEYLSQLLPKPGNRAIKEVEQGLKDRFLSQPANDGEVGNSEQLLHACPSYSIRNTTRMHDFTGQTCKPRPIRREDCDKAVRKYGKTPKYADCPNLEPKQIYFDLCKFLESSIRTSSASRLALKCNLGICGKNPITIGVLQPKYGLFAKPDLWYTAFNQADIEFIIRKITSGNKRYSYDFCIITCKHKKRFIRQALIFPASIKLKETFQERSHGEINVNIVVLDSVSRQHFYRQLPNSVDEMRRINVESSTKVLDFEMLQSIAPRTFPNMRAMFSGVVDVDSDDESNDYGLKSLFGHYASLGYYTVLQEDSCWYDPWGAIITDNKHNLEPLLRPEDYRKRWSDLQKKMEPLPIHSYGLTHMSCEVFLQYGKTNQFNDPPKVCFNGHLLPSYFLNYTYTFLKTAEAAYTSLPVFLYTHLNTGHETSGRRVAYSDALLTNFLKKTSLLENTITLLLSDHGPKTTKFSQEYVAGRNEIGQAFMFMLIPRKIRKYLGEAIMASLVTNQYRFISHLDIFHALMTLHAKDKAGILATIPSTRNCPDIPIYSFMSCLCDGWAKELPDQHDSIHWLAEYALGVLNNKITSSFQSTTGGYGNCERLIGKRFDKIKRKLNENGHIVYTFDIIVTKYRGEEIFEVGLTVKRNNFTYQPELTKWRRVSIYQHFSKCKDNNVDIKLCICRDESSGRSNPARDVAKLLSMDTFTLKSQLKFLDSKCLAVITRNKPKIFRSFELINQCIDRFYNVTFDVNVNTNSSVTTVLSSVKLPQNLQVYPWLIYFVTSLSVHDGLDSFEAVDYIQFEMISLKNDT